MGRQKKDTNDVVDSTDSFTDRVFADIEKDFGEGILVNGIDCINQPPETIPWSPALDIIMGGPIEEGSWIGITGPPKNCKTVSALTFAANAQKSGRPIFYIKVEGRLSHVHLKGIKGLDLSKGMFNVVQSSEKKILNSKDYLEIMSRIVTTVPRAVIIIDSISAFVDERESNEGVGTQLRGAGSQIVAQWFRLMNQIIPVQKTIVIGITHLISNTSGMGAQYVERCPRMWLYQKDYDLRAKAKRPWKVGETQIGLEVDWLCNTSKNGPPGLTITGFFRFNTGLDGLYEIINLASSANLIKKAGAWFSIPFLMKDEWKHLLVEPDKVPQYQGGERLYQAFKEKSEWEAALRKEVMAMSVDLVGSAGEGV